MRIRTVITFVAGATAGFGAAYLGDPDHGRERRSDAGRWAAQQAVEQAKRQSAAAVRSGASWVDSARRGYEDVRTP